MKKVKFSFSDKRYEQYRDMSNKIIQLYNKIPMTEIWNIESINTTLRQINFYYESGSFEKIEDVDLLYQKVEELINHIERQAELGVKFNLGEEPKKDANSPIPEHLRIYDTNKNGIISYDEIMSAIDAFFDENPKAKEERKANESITALFDYYFEQ